MKELNKTFSNDIINIFNKVKNRDNFAFSKYADGEYKILINENITNCDGWVFKKEENGKEQKLLLESFKYSDKDYYVGISCPCCQPKSHIEWMRKNVGSSNVTWANLFVNDNYDFFIKNFIPEFNSWEGRVVLFANEEGLEKKLPFKVDVYVPLKLNSWKYPLLDEIITKSFELVDESKNQLFLFSSGPLGNMLTYLLHSYNKNNTYIDIGSTINPWVVGNNRGYLKGNSKKVCIW